MLRVTMFEQAFKNIDDVLWKEAGCTTELDYTEQASWLLFLKYLDDLEQDKSSEAALEGKAYRERSALPMCMSGGKTMGRWHFRKDSLARRQEDCRDHEYSASRAA
jgi:hypothetical protein